MAQSTIHCTVAVPNRQLFDGEVYYASVPGSEGQFGVLPGHELIMSLTKKGGVCTLYRDEAHTDAFEILLYDGIAQMIGNELTILGRLGKWCSRINGEEMRERFAAQKQLVEQLEADQAAENGDKAKLEEAKYRMNWYEIQVEWAQKNNK
jgi:F-type H+-transporting ATPase subunit epsilon